MSHPNGKRPQRKSPRRHLDLLAERWGRPLVRVLPALGTLAIWFVLLRGGMAGFAQVGPAELGAVLLLVAGIGAVAHRRYRIVWQSAAKHLRDDVELGAVLLAAVFTLVRLEGDALFPLVYVLMAFLVAFLPRAAGALLLAGALGFDAVLQLPQRPIDLALHAAFLGLFAGLYHAVLAAQVAANRLAENTAVARRLREVEERARAYRLVQATGAANEDGEDREKWLLAAVGQVEGSVGSALEVAELALQSRTVAVLLLGSDGRELKLHDCRSQSDLVRRDAFPAAQGLFGSVLKRGGPMRLAGAVKGLDLYEGGEATGAVLVVPLVELGGEGGSSSLRGVLVADRSEVVPFTDAEERLLTVIGGEVLRAMEVERVLGWIKKTRDEKERFYRAMDQLNRQAKPADVFASALDLARQLCRLDFVAFTLVEEQGGKRTHRVVRASGVTGTTALEGHRFPDNTGLVANVVRYGAPLPGRDLRQMESPLIFDDEAAIRGLAGLRILPLRAGEEVLGTLVAGSRRKGALDDDAVRILEMLAMQTAQSVLRARLYEEMERMATTDGLTGLLNHRTFQRMADEKLAVARRYDRKLSLLLTDIDHFKSVNDTYGHPVGDQVLRGVARILQESARDTDVVARYGGEEFVLVMPETDAEGAKVIAERIRERIQATVFDTELGPLKVTMSLGIATCPDVSEKKEVLIEKADQCLYFAKRNGRNRSVTVAEAEAGGRLRLAEAG